MGMVEEWRKQGLSGQSLCRSSIGAALRAGNNSLAKTQGVPQNQRENILLSVEDKLTIAHRLAQFGVRCEDGMIAEESGTGRRVYLHGEIPEQEEKE